MTLRHLYIMTTNIWISNVMRCIKNFCDVYSVDNMKDPMSYPAYLIVNFSPSFSRGTHFIAIIFDEEKNCTYFDPLGLRTAPKQIEDFMKKNSKNVEKIHHPIQNPFSGYCGFYCMMVIMIHANKMYISSTLYNFPLMSLKNDELCISVLTKLFELYFLKN